MKTLTVTSQVVQGKDPSWNAGTVTIERAAPYELIVKPNTSETFEVPDGAVISLKLWLGKTMWKTSFQYWLINGKKVNGNIVPPHPNLPVNQVWITMDEDHAVFSVCG